MVSNKSLPQFSAVLQRRQKLTGHTFEIYLSRPRGFGFTPGQRIRLKYAHMERDYSLINTPDSDQLGICVRHVAGGLLSPILAKMTAGTQLQAVGPLGYFTFKPSSRKPVFAATGTGIAPFTAMTRSGVTDFILLHGVRNPEDLYYKELFLKSARQYIPCISGAGKATENHFKGRLTAYLRRHLDPGAYDFYLCGRNDMIRDVLWLIDDRFPESLVYTEIFY